MFKVLKRYYHTITDFLVLNNYVFKTTCFLNNFEKTINSDLSDSNKIDMLICIYSDYKTDLNLNDFYEGLPEDKINKFRKE